MTPFVAGSTSGRRQMSDVACIPRGIPNFGIPNGANSKKMARGALVMRLITHSLITSQLNTMAKMQQLARAVPCQSNFRTRLWEWWPKMVSLVLYV